MKRRERSALLIIDMTNDFLYSSYNPSLALERAQSLISIIRSLQEEFLSRREPVIFVSDRHLSSDYELIKWGPHSMKGTAGSRIAEGFITEGLMTFERKWNVESINAINSADPPLFEIEKGTYSGFTDNGGQPTALHALLNKLNFRPGDNLCITGLHTNACDKHTAADAWFRGYHPIMVSDCTDAFDDPDGEMGMSHSNALKYEKFWYNAEIMESAQVVEKLDTAERE